MRLSSSALVLAGALACVVFIRGAAQTTADPFPTPITFATGVITVGVAEFARLPETNGPARMMLLLHEPGSRRLFVNDMNGPLYAIGADGAAVVKYLDVSAAEWQVDIQRRGSERGFQSFAFHPQFAERGAPGFGKFYTFVDTSKLEPRPDFLPLRDTATHDTVLFEWTARDPLAAVFDGGPPRELMRLRQPFDNHNGGLIAFNPYAQPGTPEYGLLYVGVADGGGSGDPLGHAQSRALPFGKLLRIDPLGTNSRNGKYGVPADNPFVSPREQDALPEIYALGVRNPQRFAWDERTGALFLADIGQAVVEEISVVRPGANLGWNVWEGSFRYAGAQVSRDNQRADATITFPVAEYAHRDQLLLGRSAITGVIPYRGTRIPQLRDMLLFGDNPSGEVFYVNLDPLPQGGQDAIRRVLFRSDSGRSETLLQLLQRGSPGTDRVDLRFGTGPDGRIFLLNKHDGIVREVRP